VVCQSGKNIRYHISAALAMHADKSTALTEKKHELGLAFEDLAP
jgi:hypothetical protein